MGDETTVSKEGHLVVHWIHLDDIIKDKDTAKTRYEIVSLCDYIVDGPFELDQKDLDLAFRGSGNQTIWKNNKGTFEKYEVD